MATREDSTDSDEMEEKADQGSDYLYDFICKPCNSRGKILEAEGMCSDCQEFLCQRCFDCHTIPSVTQHHVMLDKQQMLKTKVKARKAGKKAATASKKDKCTVPCEEHEDEIIQYYCPEHCSLGCQVCVTLNHKQCPPALYIPKVATNIEKSKAFKKYGAQMKNVEEECKRINRVAEKSKELIDSREAEAKKKFKEFKTEMMEAMENAEEQFEVDVAQVISKETKKVKTLVDLGQKTQTEVKTMSNNMQTLQSSKQYCNLYIAMMKQKGTLLELENKLGKLTGNIRQFQYEVDKGVTEILAGQKPLGKLQAGTIKKLESVATITVKSADDKVACQVTGLAVLQPGSVIVSDMTNKKLKIISTIKGEVISELPMMSDPYCIASIGNHEVAVTLPSARKIAFVIKSDTGLSVDRTMSTNGTCYGIDYRKGLMAVSYLGPGKVEVMDIYGTILHHIENDGKGESLFLTPESVTLSLDGSFLYVSDWNKDKVILVKLGGSVLATYTDKKLKCPLQAAVDIQGMAYICGKDSNTVHQVTKDGKKVKEMLKSSDGLNKPACIVYSQSEGKFYIGQRDSDKVRVFNAKLL